MSVELDMDIFRTIVPPVLGIVEEAAIAAKLATAPPTFQDENNVECQYFYVWLLNVVFYVNIKVKILNSTHII